MKQYYITSNVNDRNATAKSLVNGEKFDIWFTPSVVRHYDEQGDLICSESGVMNWDEVERIDPTTQKVTSVCFSFGSFVTLTVTVHEGLTFDECVALRGSGDIDEYLNDSGEWVKCEAGFRETLDKLNALRDRADDAISGEELENAFVEEAEKEMHEMADTMAIVERIAEKVEQTKSRSAWAKGVKEYAVELVENLKVAASDGRLDASDMESHRMVEKAALDGASDWAQYSWGGCSLIYDRDIAERLCTQTELHRTDCGRKEPNRSEGWLDVQARALRQAAQMVLSAAQEVTAEAKREVA